MNIKRWINSQYGFKKSLTAKFSNSSNNSDIFFWENKTSFGTKLISGICLTKIEYNNYLMVNFEITGSFTNYLKFRNVIANKNKIVNIESEKIDTDETPGQIVAAATVSLVKAAD